MRILIKVWFKNHDIKHNFYRDYEICSMSKEDIKSIINNIEIDRLHNISNIIKANLPIPNNNYFNCINGLVDKKKKEIMILVDVYVTTNYLRCLKIKKLLENE